MVTGQRIGRRSLLIGICTYTQVQRVFYRHDATYRGSLKKMIRDDDMEVMTTFHTDPDLPILLTDEKREELNQEYNAISIEIACITKCGAIDVEDLSPQDRKDHDDLSSYLQIISDTLTNPDEYALSLHMRMLYPFCKENLEAGDRTEKRLLLDIFYAQLKYLKAITKDTVNDKNQDHQLAVESRRATENRMISCLLQNIYHRTGLTDEMVLDAQNRSTYGYVSETKKVRGKEIKVRRKIDKKIGKFTAISDLGFGSVMCDVVIEMIEMQLVKLREAYERMGLIP